MPTGFKSSGWQRPNPFLSGERAARASLQAENNRGKRLTAKQSEVEKERAERREKLAKYTIGQRVRNGNQIGKIFAINMKEGYLEVKIIPTMRQAKWAPDFLSDP